MLNDESDTCALRQVDFGGRSHGSLRSALGRERRRLHKLALDSGQVLRTLVANGQRDWQQSAAANDAGSNAATQVSLCCQKIYI